MWAQTNDFNGEVDSTFGTDGYLLTDIGGAMTSSHILAVKTGPDGKIYVAGSYEASNSDMLVARFNADGTLDNSFGGMGFVRIDPQIGADDGARAMDISADGKIVLAGSTSSGNGDYALVVLTSDGIPDTSFANSGYLIFGDTDDEESFRSVTFEPDGSILAGGLVRYTQSSADMTIIRTNADGTPKPTFGSNGIATFDFGTYEQIDQIVRTAPNRFYVVARIDGESEVMALSSTATLVNSWGTGGRTKIETGPNYENEVAQMKRGLNGTLLICGRGTRIVGTNNDSYMIRLNSSGEYDTTFGDMGVFIDDMGDGQSESFYDFELLDDGNMLMVGQMGLGGGINESWSMMITPAGQVNVSYGPLRPLYGYSQTRNPSQTFMARNGDGDVFIVNRTIGDGGPFKVGFLKLKTTTEPDPVGIWDKEVAGFEDALLYPNPTQGTAQLNLNLAQAGDLTITVTDLSGKVMTQQQLNHYAAGNHTISLPELAELQAGIYLVNATNGQSRTTLKLIKQ